MLNVAMISTGEEVLHGDITDTNAAWLSRLFFEQGYALSRRTTVGDQLDGLAREIEHCSLTADIVVVNGGLGPTSDDLTAQAAAMAANTGLELSEHWVAEMEAKYARMGREMPETNLKQALLPQGAEILDNPVGTACGFVMRINRAIVLFTPGVPSEFKIMVQDQVLPYLKALFPSVVSQVCQRLYTFGLSESGISQTLSSLVVPEGVVIGYRSALPFIEVKVFAPQNCPNVSAFYRTIIEMLGDNVVGIGQPMLSEISGLLQENAMTVSVIEEFTGGALVNELHRDEACASLLKDGRFARDFAKTDKDLASLAEAHRRETNADVVLVVGGKRHEAVSVALAGKGAVWVQQVASKRQYSQSSYRTVIATLALDMLRRYLCGMPVFGHYESLSSLSSFSNERRTG
ncbi:CinA family nicotinamide mononucleotide deamidase-related protein [Photobacterium aquae]|nr:CinA family nicotinamide mononucleotide deamidase-related protein [Photobacterium aquae]